MKSKQSTNKPPVSSYFLSPGQQRTRNESSIDWSMNVPEAPTLPQPCVPLGSNRKSRTESSNSGASVLNYGNNQPSIASFWNGVHHALSIFRTDETSNTDAANIALSITRLTNYLRHNPADKKALAGEFVAVVKAL